MEYLLNGFFSCWIGTRYVDVCAYYSEKRAEQKLVGCVDNKIYKLEKVMVLDEKASKAYGKKMVFVCSRKDKK